MKKVVLIAEDYGDLLELMKWSLEKEGFEVLLASDGLEAWELIKVKSVDLLISDFNMPKMNGKELILRVKSEFPELPIILSSSYQPRDIGLSEESIYSFAKPYDVHKLFNLIHKLLSPPKI